jgi:hypothetical protein
MSDGTARFWQPSQQSAQDFVGAYLETGLAAAQVPHRGGASFMECAVHEHDVTDVACIPHDPPG